MEKKKGLKPVAKWGEAICNGNIVNFLKEHLGCHCGSVFYKFLL